MKLFFSLWLLIEIFPSFLLAAPPELPETPTIPMVNLTLGVPTEPGDLVTTLNIVVYSHLTSFSAFIYFNGYKFC